MAMTAQHTEPLDDIFTMGADPVAACDAAFSLTEYGSDRLNAAKTPLDDDLEEDDEDEDDEDLDDEEDEDDFEDDDEDLDDDDEDDDLEDDEDDEDEDEDDEELDDEDDPKPLRVKTR